MGTALPDTVVSPMHSPRRQPSPLIGHLVAIYFFTYVGVLCRTTTTTLCDLAANAGLTTLGNSFFLANLIGSFVMGIATGVVDLFKPYQSWHIGITVGFCGCCTTFSAWQRSAAVAFLDARWIDSLIQLFTTYVGSYCAFACGLHIGKRFFDWIDDRSSDKPSVRTYRNEQFTAALLILACISVITTVAVWCGIFVDPAQYRRMWWASLALAPAGSFIRFFLSKLNPKFPTFPVFTFLVNAVGSALSMTFLVVQQVVARKYYTPTFAQPLIAATINATTITYSSEAGSSMLRMYDLWVGNAVCVGVLGSLTTVSTFVKEIYFLGNINIRHAYVYAFVSVMVSQLCCIAIGCARFA